MRWIGRIAKGLGLIVLALLSVGAIYQQVGRMLDQRWAPPRREMVLVTGHTVHVKCMGQGPRTVVLDAGLGGWSFDWWLIQPKLASLGRVCAFDRPGLGWSDAAPIGHDGTAAADQLHAAVRAAGLATPFVYVGHSLGANFAMIYASRYPRDVSALVLMEPGDPKDMREDFHGSRAQAFATPECDPVCHFAGVAAWFGVTRLAALPAGRRHFAADPDRLAEYHAGLSRPSEIMVSLAELAAVPRTAYETDAVRSFGATPVLVLASTALRRPEGKETAEDVKRWRVGYMRYLASLAAMSSRGDGPVAVPGSDHVSMVTGKTQTTAAADDIAAFALTLPPAP